MHNISKKHIQDIAAEIVALCLQNDTQAILNKARMLFEASVLLNGIENSDVDSGEKLTLKKSNEEIIEKQQAIDTTENTVIEEIKRIEEIDKPLSEVEKIKVQEIIQKNERIQETLKRSDENIMPRLSMEEEMKISVSATSAAEMFENQIIEDNSKKSVNDLFSNKQLKIDLNDRIAFVKHLFNGNLADYNRVVSQLNTFENLYQVKDFINNIVKSDMDWTGKEEYELRLIQLLERKFS